MRLFLLIKSLRAKSERFHYKQRKKNLKKRKPKCMRFIHKENANNNLTKDEPN